MINIHIITTAKITNNKCKTYSTETSLVVAAKIMIHSED
jgi:hypothetical protein